MVPALPIDARMVGILGKFDPCQCFGVSGFRNFGEIRAWQHFSNLGCEHIDRDRLSPRFLKPEMQKVIEEQCTMYCSNLFVFVDAFERGGDVAF